MYSDWTKAELIERIKDLELQINELENENENLYDENATLQIELKEQEIKIEYLSEENNNLSKEIQEYEDFYGEDYEGSILYTEVKKEF